jgi:hypothetical protein
MPIVGNGDIASVLTDRPDRLYFASGVSNSGEDRDAEYRREIELLLSQDTSQHIVYFSSLSVYYADSRYARHKRYMEKLVKGFRAYTIIRLGNIDWGSHNTNTIINHFREQKRRGESLDIQDTYRYIVGVDEFLHWVSLTPEWSCEINIPGKRMKIQEIVDTYV